MEQTTDNNSQTIQNDEIDLRELFAILRKRKNLILSLTIIFTIIAIFYTMTLKPIPMYKGSALIEIGQIINEQYDGGKYSSLSVDDLDNLDNLKELITAVQSIDASIPKNTKLLSLSVTENNKDIIKPKLVESIAYILDRHSKMAKLYAGQNYRINMTQQIGDIKIEDITKQPKKKLIIIVAFITGLMLSIFLAFFLEFIGGMKKNEKEIK